MEALNGGKVFANAYLSDLGGCIKALKYCAGWADKIHGQTIPSGKYIWETTCMMAEVEAVHVELNIFKFSLTNVSSTR